MKKLPSWAVVALSLLGVAVLGAVLAVIVLRGACAGNTEPISTMPPATAIASEPATSTPESSAEPTAEPTPEPTAEPTEEPTPEPTPEPTEEPTPEPTGQTTVGGGANDLPAFPVEDD